MYTMPTSVRISGGGGRAVSSPTYRRSGTAPSYLLFTFNAPGGLLRRYELSAVSQAVGKADLSAFGSQIKSRLGPSPTSGTANASKEHGHVGVTCDYKSHNLSVP